MLTNPARFRFGKWLSGKGDNLISRIFPRRMHLNEKDEQMLQKLFPELNLGQLRFYEGLPWFVDESFANAITLPGRYALNSIHIHFCSFRTDSIQGLSTLIHECYHALQYQELYKSRGIGLFRIFMVHYVAEFLKLFFRFYPKVSLVYARLLAYEQHPMEIPAFDKDYRIQAYLEKYGIEALYKDVPEELITRHSGHHYSAGNTPLIFAIIIALSTAVFVPVLELFIFIGALFSKFFGSFFSVIRL